jgi:alpha-methylacyl-CoA racemase
MTGWGQDGPYAPTAGHDINYIALAGVLAHLGRAGEKPTPPINLVGDFGGGGMLLAFGMVRALLEAQRSGEGQVVDAAMVDGSASSDDDDVGVQGHGHLERRARHQHVRHRARTSTTPTSARRRSSSRSARSSRSSTPSCSSTPGWRGLRRRGGPSPPDGPGAWPELKERLPRSSRRRPGTSGAEIMEGTDVCFAPVLTMDEAAEHPHNVERGTFVEVAGITQPAPSPRFSRTPGAIQRPPAHAGQHTDEILAEWLGADTAE